MTNTNPVVGWTSAYLSSYPTVPFTEARKQALVDRIRKRKYNFTHQAHQTLFYAAPFYEDNVLCVLNKQQWDEVLSDAYHDEPLGRRLMPEDVIERRPINTVLYEKEKWEPKEGEQNG
jgi:chorismate-pyruvate lyase